MHLPSLRVLAVLSLTALLSACRDELSSDEQARRAYLGLDKSIEKSLQLGFAGFNAASSANIPPQSTTGDAGGTLNISGQVDQGSSANKGMRLLVGMMAYSDGEISVSEEEEPVNITYQTAAQPALELSLRNIPNGTFTGSLVGTFQMTGDIEGEVTLDLDMSGQLEDDGTGKVRRKAGSTTVTGTAKSSNGGEFQVNVTL